MTDPTTPMPRPDVIDRLRALRGELEGMGVRHLVLFGSVARGAAGSASDIDLLAELDWGSMPASGFAALDRIDAIEQRIGAEIGRPVDLVTGVPGEGPLKRAIEQDGLRVF